jgi:glutathione peroxidase
MKKNIAQSLNVQDNQVLSKIKKSEGSMSVYEYSFNDSKGNLVLLSSYAGKVLLLVNTATKCGLAPQFEALEVLHKKYQHENFALIGFPCNQFLNQEPESDASMVEVCKINFGVTFLLSGKINVNGKNTHPLFRYLKKTLHGGLFSNSIKWNFTKFLVDKNGIPYKRYAPALQPSAIEADIITLMK